MPLPSHVGDLKNQVLCHLALKRQIVLLGVLRARILGRLTEQEDGTEQLPVLRRSPRRIQNSVERVGKRCCAILAKERRIELRVEHKRAAAEGWLRAELFEHKLFNGIIEDSVPGA